MRPVLTKTVAALSLLVLGGAVGIALDRSLHSPGGHLGIEGMHSSPEAHRDAAIEELHRVLTLDSDQMRHIDSVVQSHQMILEADWETLRGELAAVVDSVHREIEAVLTEEQRGLFRSWAARHAPRVGGG
jgi:hypothetical protein